MTTSRLTDEQIEEVARIAGKSGTAVRLRRETLIALLSEVRERREGERRQADEGARYWAETKALTHGAAVAVSEGARASGVTFIGREDEPLGICDMRRGGSRPHPRSFCCDNWRPAPAPGDATARGADPFPERVTIEEMQARLGDRATARVLPPPGDAAPADDERCICGHRLDGHRHPLATVAGMVPLSKALASHCRSQGCGCDRFRRRAPRPAPAAGSPDTRTLGKDEGEPAAADPREGTGADCPAHMKNEGE